MTNTDNLGELETGYIKVQLDYAPETNGKKFDEWCKKYDFDSLGSDRRAWCSSLGTYFRGASGVAFADGEMFLFYKEDLVDLQTQVERAEKAARIDTANHVDKWLKSDIDHHDLQRIVARMVEGRYDYADE